MSAPHHGEARLDVVIPSVNGAEYLVPCLEAVTRQEGDAEVRPLVPERCGPAVRELVERRFPTAVVIPVPEGTPIPHMRRVAFERAEAPTVAVIEDHVMVPADWARRILAARREGHRVVGGSVHNDATETLVDRAAFLCEYGHMLEPQPPGPADWLTGNNVAYDRELLERFRDVIAEGRWENRLHDALRGAGVPLMSRPEIRVGHRMHYTALAYAGQRFLYSRAYAALRVRDMPPVRRVAYGLGGFLLPPMLLLRIVRNTWRLRSARRDALLSLPMMLLFVTAWALGESVGAVAGGGDALGRVR